MSGASNIQINNLGQQAVAVLGARGYSGAELARLLLKHSGAKLSGLFATQGFLSGDLLPELSKVQAAALPGQSMHEFASIIEDAKAPFHTVFLATPAEVSLEWAPKLLKKGMRVIDVSGAFRLKGSNEAESKALYSKWYGFNHTETGLVQEADYGLVPFASGEPKSGLVANPGCFATAAALAMIPLYRADLVRLDTVSIDAKSGTTGAGKKAEERLLHAEVDGGCLPYRIGRHQHEPEIAEAVSRFGLGNSNRVSDVSFSFVPHLLPVRRGIIVSVHARLKPGVTDTQVTRSFEQAYGEYPLMRMASLQNKGAETELVLRRVVGSSRTAIAWHVRGDQLVVFSLIDNLLKGAASQAIENFNRFIGLPVETGLTESEGVL
jgi:N-acetyl-gamma-glutamyl-phosphate reductase